MPSESIKVAIRFRGNEGDQSKASWDFESENSIKAENGKTMSYDIVLDPDCDQKLMYELCARDIIAQFTLGFNATIFAYGQSGSGKTFSMLGPDDVVDAIKEGSDNVPEKVQKLYGIIPRAVFDIFTWINLEMSKDHQTEFEIKVFYFEIYNESLNNLLTMPPQKKMKMREMKNGSIVVLNCEPNYATSPEDIFELLKIGQMNRAVAGTNQNARSSRSHTIFVLDIEQKNSDGSTKSSRLNLVDLAGSERIDKTGATGQTLKEAQKINLSLTTLGMCIKSLTEGQKHVPFRDSKLTMFLKQSLGGNSKTLLICTASALARHYEESYQTCRFAKRAKKVKNKAVSNVMRSREELETMIKKLKSEVTALKKQLTDNGIKPNAKAYKTSAGEESKGEEEKKEGREPSEKSEEDTISTSASTEIAAELEMKLEELQTAYDNYKDNSQKRILELEDLIEKAEEEKIDLDNYREKDFEIEALVSTVDEKEEEISKLQQEKDKEKVYYEAKIAEINSSLKTTISDFEDLKSDYKELKEQFDLKTKEYTQEIEELKSEKSVLEEKHSKLLQKLSDSEGKSSGKITELEILNQEIESRRATLENDKKELESRIELKQKEIDSLNDKVGKATVEKSEINTKLEAELENSRNLKKERDTIAKDLEELKSSSTKKQTELQGDITKLESEKESLLAKILEVEKERDTLDNCVKENSDTKELLEEKDQMIKALKDSISVKVQQAEEVKDAEIDTLKQQIDEADGETEKVKASLGDLQEQMEQDLQKKDAQIKETEAIKDSIKEELDKKEHEVFKLSEENQSLNSKIESEQQTTKSKEELIQSLKERLEVTQDTVQDLEKRNKNLEEASQQDSEDINKELTTFKADNEVLKEKISNLEKEISKETERITTKLETAREELKEKSEQTAKLEAENVEIKRQNQELTEKVDELKRKINDLKVKTDREVRLSTIAMMNLQKAKKVPRKIVEGADEDAEEVDEGIISGPFTRKSTIVRKKIKFNDQVIDPSILNKEDWQLTAAEKYQKSIAQHYKNQKIQESRRKGMNYRDANMEDYGNDIIDADDFDNSDGDEGVFTG